MTAQNALNRIKWDTPIKSVANSWQYEEELKVLQEVIDKYHELLEGIKLLNALDQMNVKVLLQAKS